VAASVSAIHGGGTGFARQVLDTVTLSNGKKLADIDDVVTGASLDFQVGSVAELTVGAVDPGGLLKAGLLDAGSTLTYDGHRFEVAAVERDYQGIGLVLSFAARSRLARKLRNTMGPETTTGMTPAAWITRAAKRAGGTAMVQPGAVKRKIVQKRGESVLDVIGNLASDMATEWVEHSNRLFVGTGWWALQGATGLPLWSVKVGSPSCLSFQSRSSLDDRDTAATASLSVPFELGSKLRPWHCIDIKNAADADNGIWLVQSVSYDLSDIAVPSISLYRPLKSGVKKHGSSSTGDGAGPDLGATNPGSQYTDAPRPSGWSGKSVAAILARYKANRTVGLGHGIYNSCLFTAQEIAGYTHFGDNPNVLWPQLPTARRHTSHAVVPGAVVLYRTSNRGHAVVYLGDGMVLSTDMDENGNWQTGKWSICPADACERNTGGWLGWYSP
jgi:hypothetical protein